MDQVNFFWFRRDLRLNDNHGLFQALTSGGSIIPVFIFDTNILNDLQDKADARVMFIHDTLKGIKEELRLLNADIKIEYGNPSEVWKKLLEEYKINKVFANRDYEPYAAQRDQKVAQILNDGGSSLHTFKDHVVFEKGEVVKDDGNPYVVFTPYKNRWMNALGSEHDFDAFANYPSEDHLTAFKKGIKFEMPTLKDMGFQRSDIDIPPKEVRIGIIKQYDKMRDYPAEEGTSRLGIHFRFGTISIREKARKAREVNATYLNELIWRDFYSQILAEFPKIVHTSFKEKYDQIQWRNDEGEFERWCNGRTGYKIVDAGMRELNTTGYMHNRVRMITASFLTKHLLVDWRWGEAYFAKKLLDFDLASNNGGWQWASGSGTDAAPYFRIFNPYTQVTKFDKDLNYIKKWVPEHNTSAYPKEIVDHKYARERCLETYKKGLE